ncbi:hypothetical protein Patl1_10732 [Pistacia atlantica]|uniref:Uncharacterized protein n=1 Tax=Pistacia atlantica TaxID=434234 RepID=A0ACC1A657_9ROSI|nr:hypothetical protein Patl1_10732 [Pistacia atlantica]
MRRSLPKLNSIWIHLFESLFQKGHLLDAIVKSQADITPCQSETWKALNAMQQYSGNSMAIIKSSWLGGARVVAAFVVPDDVGKIKDVIREMVDIVEWISSLPLVARLHPKRRYPEATKELIRGSTGLLWSIVHKIGFLVKKRFKKVEGSLLLWLLVVQIRNNLKRKTEAFHVLICMQDAKPIDRKIGKLCEYASKTHYEFPRYVLSSG